MVIVGKDSSSTAADNVDVDVDVDAALEARVAGDVDMRRAAEESGWK